MASLTDKLQVMVGVIGLLGCTGRPVDRGRDWRQMELHVVAAGRIIRAAVTIIVLTSTVTRVIITVMMIPVAMTSISVTVVPVVIVLVVVAIVPAVVAIVAVVPVAPAAVPSGRGFCGIDNRAECGRDTAADRDTRLDATHNTFGDAFGSVV